jgi:cobalt-zinc-cadmium efflux system outer membrane protein
MEKLDVRGLQFSYLLLAGVLLIGAVASGQQPLPRQLSLKDAEAILFERNLTVAVSRRMVEAAEAQRLMASYRPNPQIQLGGEQIVLYSPVPNSAPRFFETNPNAGANPVYTFQVQQLLERGGKRELRTGQAGAQVEAARAQVLDVFRTQLFQLRQAFAAAILARENLKLAELTNQQYEQTERLTQTRVDNGDAAPVELYRVRSGHLQYRQAMVQARTAYQQALRDVLNILGTDKAEAGRSPAQDAVPFEVVGDFVAPPVSAKLPDLRTAALENRPDLRAARFTMTAAEQGTRLAEALRHRDISVAMEYQHVGDDSSLGMIVQIPLFVFNNQKAAAAQATALQLAASSQYRQTQIQVLTDVEKAYQAYLAAKESLELYSQDNLAQVEKLRDVAGFSFKEGASSLFEALDAQRTANQTLAAYNQARSDYQVSVWQLEQAIGHELP